MSATPRVVTVTRPSEYDELVHRHGTRGQAAFFLSQRGQDVSELEARAAALRAARSAAAGAIPTDWRRVSVDRAELPTFLFEPLDLVVVLGQDGLVANVAKYLTGQPVIGVDPTPGAHAGVLVPHHVEDLADVLRGVVAGRADLLARTMVQAVTDDRQRVLGLNEVFVGQPSHQSARYVLDVAGTQERQSSSGLIVGTGTGSTGWCASLHREHREAFALPAPADRHLSWFVREAWPSPQTGVALTAGLLDGDALGVTVESEGMVAFADGMEADHLRLSWGQRLTVGIADRVLVTVRGVS